MPFQERLPGEVSMIAKAYEVTNKISVALQGFF